VTGVERAGAASRRIALVGDPPLRPAHSSIGSAATLLITGDRDAVVPRGCQQQLARGIRKARWHIVRDSGHATPVDQPEEFNRVVLEFLKDEG
jgi:pimeloyl-ACP methyl ester carboxylesterase